jgi:hypothetical protein
MSRENLSPGDNPSWMQCSDRYGCGRWFSRIEDFDRHLYGETRRRLSDEELAKAGVAFLRPERRAWAPDTGRSIPTRRSGYKARTGHPTDARLSGV